MKDTGKPIENHGKYCIYEWTGPRVDSGELLPYSSSLRGSFDWKRHATLEEARAHLASAPTMRTVRVEFEAYVPVAATDEQIEEWIDYELHANGSIQKSNPLSSHSLEARDVSVEHKR